VVLGMASSMFEEIANNITNDNLKILRSDSVLTSVAFRAMALPFAQTKFFSS
jgi:hypothetical protein